MFTFLMTHHIHCSDLAWKDLGGGIRRQVIAQTPEIMGVLVEFRKGAVGALHDHEIHTQISHVTAGSFEVEVGGVKKVLKTGDTYIAPPRTAHGVVALEDGSRLLDVFTPRRDDFL